MSDIETIAIIGAGLAGAKAAEALRKEGYAGRLVLLGEESHPPYLRPPLSKEYLRGETPFEKVLVQPAAWYDEQRVELDTASRVDAIDVAGRRLVLDDGRAIGFDHLLIATGSEARRLKVPGSDLDGIHHLRTLEDADGLRGAAAPGQRAVVVGGGWIAAEVAASLRQLGLTVTFVMPGSVPLERVLGPEVGSVYRDTHAGEGVTLVPHRRVTAFHGSRRVEWVEVTDGRRIEADLVVVGVGAFPRIRLARAAGIEVGDGIVVDERLETSAPGIFAAGDVAAAWHPVLGARIRVEHWDNARRQGRVAGRNMLGMGDVYSRVPYFYSDQFDLGMEYAGFPVPWDRVVFRGDPASHEFIAFWLRDGRVVAGMNVNVWKVNEAIGALVASGGPVDLDRLADPAVPLQELQPTSASTPGS